MDAAQETDLVVYLSRWGLAKPILFGIFLCLIGLAITRISGEPSNPLQALVMWCLRSIGYVSLSCSIMILGWSSWRLVHWRPAFVLGKDGLIDSAYIFPIGLVRWHEIDRAVLDHMWGIAVFEILVVDCKLVIGRLPKWRQLHLRIVKPFSHCFVQIPAFLVAGKIEDLIMRIEARKKTPLPRG